MSKDSYHNQQDKFIVDCTISPTTTTIYQILSEILDKVDCLQRAVAMVSGQHSDFKAEYSEDMAEVNRQLSELRRNKVWLLRERI